MVDWDKQCQVFKQQVEAVLNDGFDFISIIITQGPSDNFLNAVRRVGAYQLMSYYWGADYSDPETEVYPFYQEAGDRGTCYSFLRTGVEDGIVTGETADLVMQYMSMVENAKTITEDPMPGTKPLRMPKPSSLRTHWSSRWGCRCRPTLPPA